MSSTDLQFTLMSGAGNRFAVLDCFAAPLPADPRALAIAVCAAGDRARADAALDGLIVVGPSTKNADCTMWIFNADGSRPETCGNGLRCLAKLVTERGYVPRDTFTIRTDAGVRSCTVRRRNGRVVAARVHMGVPRLVAKEQRLALSGGVVTASIVEIGNPHCVLIVDDERTAPVSVLGPQIQTLDLFPRGVNVGFLACRSEGAFLRVWERGVGETRACGSGACAAAYIACLKEILRWPVRIELAGGALEIDLDVDGGVLLTGPVEECGSITSPSSSAVRVESITPDAAFVAQPSTEDRPEVDRAGAVQD